MLGHSELYPFTSAFADGGFIFSSYVTVTFMKTTIYENNKTVI
jgi:hypothetical protein